MNSRCTQFKDAIHAAGLEPPQVIEPGRYHRFPGKDKCPSNRAGWCVLFSDGSGGSFGDWSSGLRETWYSNGNFPSTRESLSDAGHFSSERWVRIRAKRRVIQAEAASRALAIWNRSSPVGNHPYIRRKHIEPRGARLYNGAIVLPITNFGNQLCSLQFIDARGDKRMLRGGRKQGCFIPVSGGIEIVSRLVICEGFATGSTLAENESNAHVIAAIDAGNLKSVALTSRCKWPKAEIVIAGDDDRLTEGNPGATKAQEAAAACGGALILPSWPVEAPHELTDFNDLKLWLRGEDR